MRNLKTFLNRQADQEKARQRLADRVKRVSSKAKPERAESSFAQPGLPLSGEPDQMPAHAWKSVRALPDTSHIFTSALDGQHLGVQPWASGLVNVALEAAELGGVYLCLIWPAKVDSLAILHSLANIERNFCKDLRGIRTILFPGTYTSRLALQSVYINRAEFCELYRTLWASSSGATTISAQTRSPSFEAALDALNDIERSGSSVDGPTLGALAPCFIYDEPRREWISSGQTQLEIVLRKVPQRKYKQDIRQRIDLEWRDPSTAPCALLVIHHSATKKTWKDALASPALKAAGSSPELFILNATSSADQANFRSVRRIPEFLKLVDESGYGKTGAVVITDDPKTFFFLRSRLAERKQVVKTKVWAAEGSQAFLSAEVMPTDWVPQQRSNVNFAVAIQDREASQVALTFQRLAEVPTGENSPARDAVMAACLYILRLSNLPSGYKDLTEESADQSGQEFGGERNAWTPIRLGIQAILNSGALNTRRVAVDKAISKAERLIEDWSDATPMAVRLLAEVNRYAIQGREGLSIVLPNKNYIVLANRFLQRKIGERWASVESNLDWNTLSSISGSIGMEHKGRHLVFIGINRSVLRILITHFDIPNGTTILAAYQQAKSALMTLKGMEAIDEFTSYRGRISLLITEIEKRLAEIPNPLDIGKLGELKLTFTFDDSIRSGNGNEQDYFRFQLEGGSNSIAAGFVFRYEPEDSLFFRRVSASSINVGDLIFDMDDELRNKIELALHIKGEDARSVVYPERALLKLYHDDVRSRCDQFFTEKKRSVLARQIRMRMIEIDPKASECKASRVYYWLALGKDGDTRPHAPRDANFFKAFCKALKISDEGAVTNWNFIRNARRLNQNLGRELSARYAEILFQPESAITYRKVPEALIKQLQQDALRCVYRVERIFAPHQNGNAAE